MRNKFLNLTIILILAQNVLAQTNDSIYVHFPEYGVNELHNTHFVTSLNYFGVYQKDGYGNLCELIQLAGKDTSAIDYQGKVFNYQKLDKAREPAFVICMNQMKPINNLPGRVLNNKMIFPGDEIRFGLNDDSYIIYSKGTPILNSSQDGIPYSTIEDYEVILRKTNQQEVSEQIIFSAEKVTKGGLPYVNPGVYFDWVGDLNQDGKIDLLLTTVRHHECIQVVFLMSSSEDQTMVQEIYREINCS